MVNDDHQIDKTTLTKLVTCTGATLSCTDETAFADVSYGYYAKANDNTKLIGCINGTTCAALTTGATGYYASTDKDLYSCTDGTCEKKSNSSGYYVDKGTTGNVIYCNSSNKCVSETGIGEKGYAYIDASATGNDAKKKFITCAGDGNPCTSAKDNALDTDDSKHYVIDPSSPTNYIECTGKEGGDATCTTKATSSLSTTMAFFTDGTDNTYRITCIKNGGCFSSKGK